MSKARDMFAKGDRVERTALAASAGLLLRARYGVVVGFGRNPEHVRVRPADRKTVSTYHIDFWRPAPRPPRES